jgi:acyl carrier protein
MDRESIVAVLAEALEVDAEGLQDDTDLHDIETFDSAGLLAIVAGLDMQLGVRVDPDRLVACESVADLVGLVQESSAQ